VAEPNTLDGPYAIRTQDGLAPCTPHRAGTGPALVRLEPGRYSWCSCGYSLDQPFCDGRHKDPELHTNRRSVKFEIAEAQTVKLCLCKHTKTPPFCDGSHETLGPLE
jgi:CDGSH iron-sulfur domain-containing protein 3